MRTIAVSDEQYARLQALGELYHATPERLLSAWLDALLAPSSEAAGGLSIEEYDRRWKAFMRLVGGIQRGKPLTDEEIGELIGAEAAKPHDAEPTDAGGHPTNDQAA